MSLEEEPELHNVYRGRVSQVKERACFVELCGFKGKKGVVHISEIGNRRIGNVKDFLKRDQEVFVKVVSVNGKVISLSMRDVDQRTGELLVGSGLGSVMQG